MDGRRRCGLDTTIEQTKERIRRHYHVLLDEWKRKYGYGNKMLELHARWDNVHKYIWCFDKIFAKYPTLERVSLVGCSAPVVPSLLLREKYPEVKIVIVSDHPVLDRMGDHFVESYNAEIRCLNPLFEDFSDSVAGSNLIVFPEYEYFIPLDMCKSYPVGIDTALIHYVGRVEEGNAMEPILCQEDLLEWANFREVHASDELETEYELRTVYFALGLR